MDLIDFCKAHGILVNSLPPIGVWKRYPTEDHPKSKNGAVKYMGDHAFVQNHATQTDVSVWKSESVNDIDREKFRLIFKREADLQAKNQKLASDKAAFIIKNSQLAHHNYFKAKGFPDETGYVWVSPDGQVLAIPMRIDGHLVGCQLIDEHGSKKFLYGQRSNDAEFVFDNKGVHIYCEGYATALSVRQALKSRKIRYTIHVCFSAHNLLRMTQKYGHGLVIADNDKSGTGQKIAKESMLPYWISDMEGEDGNDYHLRMGLFRFSQGLASKLIASRELSTT